MELFSAIFDKTLSVFMVDISICRMIRSRCSLFQEHLEAYIRDSYDSVSILICIQIASKYQQFMNSRKITVLNNYFETIKNSCWTRLKVVLEANFESIKTANAKDHAPVDIRAHYVNMASLVR